MEKKYVVALVLFLFLSNLFQCYISGKQRDKCIDTIGEIEKKVNQKVGGIQFSMFELKNDIQSYLLNDGVKLHDALVYEEETDSAIKLCDVLSGKFLVLRISQVHCMACIDAIMSLLSKFDSKKILLLADYDNKRFLKKIKENHQIAYVCYRIKTPFHIPAEELHVPYLFITDENLKIECLYIPHKELLDDADECIRIMIGRLGD